MVIDLLFNLCKTRGLRKQKTRELDMNPWLLIICPGPRNTKNVFFYHGNFEHRVRFPARV
jgi:hypothetical protein